MLKETHLINCRASNVIRVYVMLETEHRQVVCVLRRVSRVGLEIMSDEDTR